MRILPALLVFVLVTIPRAAAAPAHPLHTTLATVAWHGDRRYLEVAVRVFTQDLADALIPSRNRLAVAGSVPDTTACRYAMAVLVISDAAGRSLGFASCTIRRAADVTWITLIVPAKTPVGLRVRNAFLFELFSDQINVVQASLHGRTRTILLTSGDDPKPLL